MKSIALLVAIMLPNDRAVTNARATLHLSGMYGAAVSCQAGDVGGYVCVARLRNGYAILRCSGYSAELCTMRVVK